MRKLLSLVLLIVLFAGFAEARCSVSGTVTNYIGGPMSGVTVYACVASIYGCNYATIISQVTDANGYYAFNTKNYYPPYGVTLICNEDYWVEPSYPGQTFTPDHQWVHTAFNSSVTGIDFQQD